MCHLERAGFFKSRLRHEAVSAARVDLEIERLPQFPGPLHKSPLVLIQVVTFPEQDDGGRQRISREYSRCGHFQRVVDRMQQLLVASIELGNDFLKRCDLPGGQSLVPTNVGRQFQQLRPMIKRLGVFALRARNEPVQHRRIPRSFLLRAVDDVLRLHKPDVDAVKGGAVEHKGVRARGDRAIIARVLEMAVEMGLQCQISTTGGSRCHDLFRIDPELGGIGPQVADGALGVRDLVAWLGQVRDFFKAEPGQIAGVDRGGATA